MPNLPSRAGSVAPTPMRTPMRTRRERQKVLRWATVTVLLLLAAVAASHV